MNRIAFAEEETVMRVRFEYQPHPHVWNIVGRLGFPLTHKAVKAGFNERLAVKITTAVGTMGCALMHLRFWHY